MMLTVDSSNPRNSNPNGPVVGHVFRVFPGHDRRGYNLRELENLIPEAEAHQTLNAKTHWPPATTMLCNGWVRRFVRAPVQGTVK